MRSPHDGWNTQIQITAEIAPGRTQGRITMARTSARPRNAASSRRAVKKPATTASGAVTAANAMVLRNASQKAGPVTTCR